MDSNLLLVKCITLLYLESKIGQTGNSNDFCKEIIDGLKIEETSVEMNATGEVILSLRSLVYWMIGQGKNGDLNRSQVLQRLRVATRDATFLFEAVEKSTNIEEEDEIKKEILLNRKHLREYLNGEEIKGLIKQAYKDVSSGGIDSGYRELIRDFHTRIEPFTHDTINEKHPSIVDSVNLKDVEDMSTQMERSQDETSSEGTIKLGWQGINRMTGEQSGIRRGELVLLGALQHNFKTGFTLNAFKHAALYNKPFMRDKKRKPLLLHISLENELHLNIMWLYANLYENETGKECNYKNVDTAEASKYVEEKMGANGYHIEMMRLDPNQTTVHDLIDIMMKYESEGYEIHMVVCDYLNMVNRGGLDRSGPTGTEIRQLFRIIRNYIAPFQLTH